MASYELKVDLNLNERSEQVLADFVAAINEAVKVLDTVGGRGAVAEEGSRTTEADTSGVSEDQESPKESGDGEPEGSPVSLSDLKAAIGKTDLAKKDVMGILQKFAPRVSEIPEDRRADFITALGVEL